MAKKSLNLADYIFELNLHGMKGRMLKVPAAKNKNREILVVYGHHALIERWAGLIENLRDYGPVTMADLPGFGGMDSLYKIGQKPDLDTMADYLAAFVKMRYRRKRITIVGISYGFIVATRMLQRNPELAKKVDLVVSMVGFMHKDDFLFKPWQRKILSRVAGVLAFPPVPFLIRYITLNKFVIKNIYIRSPLGRRRFLEMEAADFAPLIDFEVKLWQKNDVRTHWATTSEFLRLDNCQKKVDLPVWHIISDSEYYFNNYIVEQHMRVVFSDYKQAVIKLHAHTPSVLGDKKEMAVMVPTKLKRKLAKYP